MADTRQAKRAALWDVDGTLIDSRRYHWLSWRGALAEENFRVTPEQFASSFGRAGMRCVGVLSSHEELRADIVVRTLAELPDNAFAELLGQTETTR